MTDADWETGFGRSLTVFLNGDGIREPGPYGERISDDSFLLCFNAHDAAIDFTLPPTEHGIAWSMELDCSTPTGRPAADTAHSASATLPVPARCLLVLRRTA